VDQVPPPDAAGGGWIRSGQMDQVDAAIRVELVRRRHEILRNKTY